jgi:hypothetical protein
MSWCIPNARVAFSLHWKAVCGCFSCVSLSPIPHSKVILMERKETTQRGQKTLQKMLMKRYPGKDLEQTSIVFGR